VVQIVDMTHRIHEFMTPTPQCIEAGLTLEQARERMFQLGARHLPVLNNGALVGIVSERDIDLYEAAMHTTRASEQHITVGQAMTPVPFTCGPDAHLHAVAAEMAANKYGSVVVVDPDHPARVLGVFTSTDALHALALLTPHDHAAAQ
jgi:acetoin utilization protein AcuB